jgi:hypothetical protein
MPRGRRISGEARRPLLLHKNFLPDRSIPTGIMHMTNQEVFND